MIYLGVRLCNDIVSRRGSEEVVDDHIILCQLPIFFRAFLVYSSHPHGDHVLGCLLD